jgi:hypothetical protein
MSVLVFTTNTTFKAKDTDIVINNYVETITVHKNKTYDVHLEIEVKTTNPNYMDDIVFKYFSLVKAYGPDRQRKDVLQTISNVKGSHLTLYYESEHWSYGGSNTVIKIVDRPLGTNDIKNYTLDYNVSLSNDTFKGYDLIYYDLIVGNILYPILNYDITVITPDPINKDNLELSRYKETNYMSYTISDNKLHIVGSSLDGSESLTLSYTLDDNYFSLIPNIPMTSFIALIITFLIPLISFLIWLKIGKDPQVNITDEYQPPLDLKSYDADYIINGDTTNKAYSSILLSLTLNGYLKLEDDNGNKDVNAVKPYVLVKLKEYDGKDKNERILFEHFFKHGSTYFASQYDPVLGSVKSTIYETIKIRNSSLMDKKSIKASAKSYLLYGTLVLATIILMSVHLPLSSISVLTIVIQLLFSGITLFSLYQLTSSIPSKLKLFSLLIIPMSIFYLFAIITQVGTEEGLIVGIPYVISLLITGMFSFLMKKRTTKGNEVLSKFLSLKRTLSSVTKETVISLVTDDPEYLVKILPFLLVFNLYDEWNEKYSNIMFFQVSAINEAYINYNKFYDNKIDLFNRKYPEKSNV